MARPPALARISRDSLGPVDASVDGLVDILLQTANPFLVSVQEALNKGISLQENVYCAIKELTFVAPDQWLAPTFIAPWENFDATENVYYRAGYTKGDDGLVKLRGIVKSGDFGTVIFNLPTGFRPRKEILVPCIQNDRPGAIRVAANGDVTAAQVNASGVDQGVNPAASVLLDGVSFEPTDTNPVQMTGAFPLRVSTGLNAQASGLVALSAFDVTSRDFLSVPTPNLWWENIQADSTGVLLIRRISGMVPGRSYKITVCAFG